MAWNHTAHLCHTDLLFALGLRPTTTGGPSRDLIKGRETSHRCKSTPSQEEELEAVIAKREALQVVFVRQNKRHTSAAARLETFEATRDEMLEELDYNTTGLREGEKNNASLEAAILETKARCSSLQNAMGYLSAERARLRVKMRRAIMPPHLKDIQDLCLPSRVQEARNVLNFSSLTSSSWLRSHTVFAILEDGMPGGRLERRKLQRRLKKNRDICIGGSAYPETTDVIASSPILFAEGAPGSIGAPTSLTKSPGCFSGMGKSADRVGDVEACHCQEEKEKALSRINTRGAKYRQRRRRQFTTSRSAPIKL